MTIRMKSGEVYSTRVERARGTAGNPISKDELEEKFFQCCRGILSESGIAQVTERLRNFERIQDIADFVSLIHKHLLKPV
jgi:2-methylcitrate dehydratase PrpD